MARPKELNGGRPRLEIDEVKVEKLAKMLLPKKKIADVMGISIQTLDRYFSEKIDVWQSDTDSKIAAVFLDECLNKREGWALKMLVQNRLEYSDKIKTESEFKHTYEKLTDEELDAEIQNKIAKLKGST